MNTTLSPNLNSSTSLCLCTVSVRLSSLDGTKAKDLEASNSSFLNSNFMFMLYVVCCMLYVCMLYVVCCMLYVVCCMLYVVCCMLYVVYCILHIVVYISISPVDIIFKERWEDDITSKKRLVSK
ncbi:hypothetical protein EYC80_000578 [Monilinia laxa]|uniref:Uncharacterized protein n=1 Tax=Monilinia laxa TaxID=61186 RepID=A0A5N6KB26_MONLA|nr:hypothetical protein EYC80_000578 [Monilinia laxa]